MKWTLFIIPYGKAGVQMLSPSEVKGIYCDTYNLYLKYHGCKSSSAKWDSFGSDYARILEKHENSRMCLRYLTGVLEQLEEEGGYCYAGGENQIR